MSMNSVWLRSWLFWPIHLAGELILIQVMQGQIAGLGHYKVKFWPINFHYIKKKKKCRTHFTQKGHTSN